MRTLIGTAGLAGAIMLAGCATAQTSETGTTGDRTMEITRKADQQAVEGPEEYFTGRATITGNFSREDPSRLTGAIVTFEPGARTAWHKHPLGQTLIVTDGVGWTQVEDGTKYEFSEGDIMWCPPDRKHWHGATPTDSMTHIAIQEALDGKNVEWMEKVTDEEYLAGEPVRGDSEG